MKIGIVGGGVVGRATARAFIERVEEVRVHDVLAERRTHPLEAVLACDLVFVCLPTPQKEGSLECDTSAVGDFFCARTCFSTSVNFVLRSTVPVGFTQTLREKYGLTNLVHSPEFLTARCAMVDAQLPARNIIGGPCRWPFQCKTEAILRDLYQSRFPGVPVMLCTSDESELIKLATNGFFAVKIAYFNEINRLAKVKGLNWERVLGGVLTDGRIAHSHTSVPGPDGKFGFGGACLPKDLANLIDCIVKARAEAGDRPDDLPGVTMGAFNRNHYDRRRTE